MYKLGYDKNKEIIAHKREENWVAVIRLVGTRVSSSNKTISEETD